MRSTDADGHTSPTDSAPRWRETGKRNRWWIPIDWVQLRPHRAPRREVAGFEGVEEESEPQGIERARVGLARVVNQRRTGKGGLTRGGHAPAESVTDLPVAGGELLPFDPGIALAGEGVERSGVRSRLPPERRGSDGQQVTLNHRREAKTPVGTRVVTDQLLGLCPDPPDPVEHVQGACVGEVGMVVVDRTNRCRVAVDLDEIAEGIAAGRIARGEFLNLYPRVVRPLEDVHRAGIRQSRTVCFHCRHHQRVTVPGYITAEQVSDDPIRCRETSVLGPLVADQSEVVHRLYEMSAAADEQSVRAVLDNARSGNRCHVPHCCIVTTAR